MTNFILIDFNVYLGIRIFKDFHTGFEIMFSMENRNAMIKKVYYIFFVFTLFCYTLISIRPELIYHLQQPAFLSNWSFFKEYAYNVGGIGIYVSNAISQLLFSNLMGSFIIVFMASVLSLLLYLIIRDLEMNSNMIVVLIPMSLVICLFHDYYFPFVVLLQGFFVFSATYLFIQFLKKKDIVLIIALFLYLFLYYIFGSGAAMVFALTCLLIILIKYRSMDLLRKSGCIVLASMILPFIFYRFIFNLSFSQAYFHFFPQVPITQHFEKTVFLYAFVFLLPLILAIVFLVSKIGLYKFSFSEKIRANMNKRKKLVAQSSYLIFFGILFGIINLTANKHKRNIAQIDLYSYQGKWDKVIESALADKEYDFSINLNYNRAIDYSGKFLDYFFDYPQKLGVASLYPDQFNTPVYGIQASDYYLDINYISKAQHLAYGLLVLEPYNPRVLKQLVLTNLILGNYKAAQTYLNVLSQNPLSSEFVDKYLPYVQDPNRVQTDPILSKKRNLQPNNFAIPLQITDRITDLILADNTNKQAYEHLQMCYLLKHEVGEFVRNFDESVNFYRQIPEVYEQALIMYAYSIRSYDAIKYKISDTSKNKFSMFLQIMKECNNDKEVALHKMSGLEDTYMYYVTYLSPKETKVEVITKY